MQFSLQVGCPESAMGEAWFAIGGCSVYLQDGEVYVDGEWHEQGFLRLTFPETESDDIVFKYGFCVDTSASTVAISWPTGQTKKYPIWSLATEGQRDLDCELGCQTYEGTYTLKTP
eukprot:TRINITY_DN68177_c7_g4_i2.p2 TRINITY_DN68177_c7_g4~~TRINITY_DN68177_c7_g4_i2.p2  ORF type:complete len:116 (+),score=8.41 TRINITY_DN68177_c7_g4_i2:72-419(+)